MEVGQAAGHGLRYVTQLSPGHSVALQVVRQRALLTKKKNRPKVKRIDINAYARMFHVFLKYFATQLLKIEPRKRNCSTKQKANTQDASS